MTLPILIAIPHGSTDFPEDKKKNLTLSKEQILELYWDYGSNELFDHKAFHVLNASFSRLFCDLNRNPRDWSHSNDLKKAGVVRQKTEKGEAIYKTPLTDTRKEARIEEHNKFYETCAQRIKEHQIQFFIAGHTMEDFPLGEETKRQTMRPDIVISTDHFHTCDEPTTHLLEEAFRAQGFTVEIDTLFLGGYLLTHFCDAKKLPGVQIEVRRGLFAQDAHTINMQQLTLISEKVERAILVFWEKFLAKCKR